MYRSSDINLFHNQVHFDPMCEGLLFTPDGKALHGIMGGRNSNKDGVPGTQEDRRVEHLVPREAVEKGTYELVVELSCNGMFGTGLNGYRHQRPDVSSRSSLPVNYWLTVYLLQENIYFKLEAAHLLLQNSQAAALELDFTALRQISLSPDRVRSSVAHRALKACNDIMNKFKSSDHYETREQLVQLLRQCREIGWKVLGPLDDASRKKLCTWDDECGPEAKVWAIGHWYVLYHLKLARYTNQSNHLTSVTSILLGYGRMMLPSRRWPGEFPWI
jgi:alpha-mannosidase